MTTPLNEPLEFLGVVATRGTWNDNTIQARRTACNKFFDILDEGEKNVEYVRDNLDVIKARYMNLNKEVAGATVDEYGRRVMLVLTEFAEWKEDRSAWEKKHAAKQSTRPAGDTEKKAKPKTEKPKVEAVQPEGSIRIDPATRTITIPLRNGDATITIPREFVTGDVKRLAWALLPYATDFDPEVSPRETFRQLERVDIHNAQ